MGFWKRLTRSLFASFRLSEKRPRRRRKIARRIKKKLSVGGSRKRRKIRNQVPKKRSAKRRAKTYGSGGVPKFPSPKKESIAKKKQNADILIGEITHYFSKIQVAVLRIKKESLLVMDPIRIEGKQTHFNQTVGSMQIDRKPIDKAVRGDEIGLQVREPVQPGDIVFKLSS